MFCQSETITNIREYSHIMRICETQAALIRQTVRVKAKYFSVLIREHLQQLTQISKRILSNNW